MRDTRGPDFRVEVRLNDVALRDEQGGPNRAGLTQLEEMNAGVTDLWLYFLRLYTKQNKNQRRRRVKTGGAESYTSNKDERGFASFHTPGVTAWRSGGSPVVVHQSIHPAAHPAGSNAGVDLEPVRLALPLSVGRKVTAGAQGKPENQRALPPEESNLCQHHWPEPDKDRVTRMDISDVRRFSTNQRREIETLQLVVEVDGNLVNEMKAAAEREPQHELQGHPALHAAAA
ncbi:hypothetical protein CRENBAI_014504 [Crenichthys baileyi]|uniref:Uncharacterized protein n=1 Tax=Crenichthys baileyi TaxID=28760 RepID=A0AAV9R3J8_9TELE